MKCSPEGMIFIRLRMDPKSIISPQRRELQVVGDWQPISRWSRGHLIVVFFRLL